MRDPRIIPHLLLVLLVFLVVPVPPVSGQERPAWVLHQLAERHYRAREFAEALEMYGDALTRQPVFPEAMVGMARVHRSAGDLTLAKRYYLRAIEDAHHLIVPDDEFAIRLELARLYELSDRAEDHRLQREQLEIVISRDPVFTRRQDELQRDAMLNLLYTGGLDRVLVLYRLNFPQALEAHRQLGVALLDSTHGPDQERAVEHLLFAAVEIAGRAVRAIIDVRFDYEFSTVPVLLDTAAQYPDVAAYLEQSGFLEVLFYLAEALESVPDERGKPRAREIREIVTTGSIG